MSIQVEIQNLSDAAGLPAERNIRRWVSAALQHDGKTDVELVVRIVDEAAIAELKLRYRKKPGPTNVLSFPFQDPPGVQTNILGDIVVCAPIVLQEASTYSVPHADRWAHMLVHGTLHLCGYDHQCDQDASDMEQLERDILAELGVANPYSESPDADRCG